MRIGKRIFWILAVFILLTGCQSPGTAAQAPVQVGEAAVSAEEFTLYFYEAQAYFEYSGGPDIWDIDFDGQSAAEVAKERALTSLKNVKLAVAHAGDFHVSLTEDDRAQAAAQAEALYDSLTEAEQGYIGLSREEYGAIMEENWLYQKVYDAVTAGYEGEEEELQAYYEANADGLRLAATYVRLSSILTEDEATGNLVYRALLDGADMAELSQEYEIEEESKENLGRIETYVGALLADYDWDLTGAQPGDILPPFVEEEGAYVIRVEEVISPDEDEVYAYAEESYISYRKQELFDQAYTGWDEAAVTTVDQDFWDGLQIFSQTQNE